MGAFHASSMLKLKDMGIPLWKEAIFSFWKLNPCLPEEVFNNPTLLRSIPLFKNNKIKLNGKPLHGEKWIRLAKRGIVRLGDLIFENKLGSKEQVERYYGIKISEKIWNTLTNVIPSPWLDTISQNPWTYDKQSLWGYLDKNGSFQVADESVEKSMWRPFKIVNDKPIFLDTQDLPTTKLFKDLNPVPSLKSIKSRLSNIVTTPKAQQSWECSLNSSPPWKTIHENLWKPLYK